jgi:heme oxygenase (mycobilin-producing)
VVIMAITSILDLRIKPEALGDAPAVIHETLAATRKFPGCLGVTVLVDSADPAHIVLYEAWDSIDSDRAYRAWRQTPEGASQLGSVLAGPPALVVYTVADDI